MARTATSLTAKGVLAEKGGEVRREIPDGGERGLYLVVQPNGKKSWALRYRFGDRTRKLTIGDDKMSLLDARVAAREAKAQVEAGRDPGYRANAAPKTVAPSMEKPLTGESPVTDVVRDFTKFHVSLKRGSTATEMERLLKKHILPAWGGLEIRAVRKRDVLAVLNPALHQGKPYLANRVFAVARKLLNWCVSGDVIAVSPIQGMSPPGEELSRDRVLADVEISALWAGAGAIGQPWGNMVKLLLLTAQRREEVAGMRWTEVDLEAEEGPLWTIPAERTKNKLLHTVPLSPQAASILRSIDKVEESDFVFTTTGKASVSGFSKAKIIVDRAMLAESSKDDEGAELVNWRFHDLRRTAVSGMASLRQPIHVVEAVVNHKTGTISGVSRTYNRWEYLDEKRHALEAWAGKVAEITSKQPRAAAKLINLQNYRPA